MISDFIALVMGLIAEPDSAATLVSVVLSLYTLGGIAEISGTTRLSVGAENAPMAIMRPTKSAADTYTSHQA